MKIAATTALVTGAASGLGAATAAALAAAGAEVLALDLPHAVEKAPAVEGVRYAAADVTSPDEVQAALDSIAPDAPPLRIVVSCAGIAPARKVLGSKGVHDLETFRKTIEVNLIGTFNVLRLAAAVIAEQTPDENGQRGVIVNTASVAAFEGQIGQVAYSASKGGVVGLMLPAARDLASVGIRVNTIAPGIVNTPLLAALGPEVGASLAASIPFPKRLARPDEFAQLVGMIVEHDYLNGETIRMDGALRMAPR
ncbi:SDR family NAD(P)-dependent oxidoreductase [Microbacterium sp. BWT-B31]|uniref:SDR family NAD(P)-dependent oxidoreductase n=1 Tax=Microbacterium sp. BWT-B31 TaxID=3232072 RepID=UPI0035283C09